MKTPPQISVAQLLEYGEKLIDDGQPDAARKFFLKAIEREPNNIDALLLLSGACERGEDSLRYLARVLEIDPRNERARAGIRWARKRVQSSGSFMPQQTSPTAALDHTARSVSQPTAVSPRIDRAAAPQRPDDRASQDTVPYQNRSNADTSKNESRPSPAASIMLGGPSMPPFLKFILRRLLVIPITLFIITAFLYGVIMFTPPEERAQLYLTHLSAHATEDQIRKLTERAIIDHGLDQSYPVQYVNWLGTLVAGEWGWSPTLRTSVLDYLKLHTPVTVELTLYALLTFIPLGVISGVLAGQRRGREVDNAFRFFAFSATSIPTFILGLFMITLLYAGLKWFAPGRLSDPIALIVKSSSFHAYTGLVTFDGLLNGRLDITLDAFKHLVMPVLTVGALHWATLGRVTRAAMVEELGKDYVTAARAHGISQRSIIWRHALRNALVPALTSSALSAASLLSGVYIVEVIFGLHGVSEVIISAVSQSAPDAPAALGFTLYNVVAVLVLMFGLDVLQAIIDPRIREKMES